MSDVPEHIPGSLKMTPEMWRAGVATLERWNPAEEEVEALVVGIFFSMWEARPCDSVGHKFGPDQFRARKL
jgi:hypothetical protein